MMMKIKMDIARPNLKLGAPDFAWQQIQIIPTDDENDHGDDDDDYDDNDDDSDDDDDDELDDEDQNGHYSVNFPAKSSIFCMVIDVYNTKR